MLELGKLYDDDHDYDVDFTINNSRLRMKLIFMFVSPIISKIAAFEPQKTHTWSYRRKCNHYEWQFGAAFDATISPYFFANEEGTTITVYGDTNGIMITDSIMVLMWTMISKIAVFGAHKTYTWSYKRKYSHYKWIFGAVCGA